ncbi:MAG: signal peptide peptidase SppA [Pseudobdellovibrio sp.]
MNGFWNKKTILLSVFIILAGLIIYNFYKRGHNEDSRSISKNEILHLEINGIIMNGKKFLHNLKKYSKEESVKAIVVEINSPGGAVGPSQEIYYELIRAKKETKKPIICVSTGLMASGGYYSALGCDQILVAPGAMIGSIGVIMEFANLEDLYSWAKIKRFTITSGKFKDSGSEYRAMRDDEKQLFQDMINEVYEQFRDTVAAARKLKVDIVSQYADGRVMTGSTAVKLGFADVEGTFEDAVRMAAQKAKLGDDYHLFKPKKEKNTFFDLLMDNDDEDDLNSLEGLADLKLAMKKQPIDMIIKHVFKTQYLNQPLFLMPGHWE